MLAWFKKFFKKDFYLAENEFQISVGLVKAILLNRTILNSKIKEWDGPKVYPRWSDFFDKNNKDHSIPLYKLEESVWASNLTYLKVPIGYLRRYSDAGIWVIHSRAKDSSVILDTLRKLGIE